MTRCLKDRTLFLLYDGEGTSAQRTHLTECESCAARYRQLGRDLEAISQVLREEGPPKTLSHRSRPFTVRWLPTAGAMALALVLIWVGVRLWSPSEPPVPKGATTEQIWTFLEQFPSDVFSLNQAIADELGTEIADADDLVGALDAEWPSE